MNGEDEALLTERQRTRSDERRSRELAGVLKPDGPWECAHCAMTLDSTSQFDAWISRCRKARIHEWRRTAQASERDPR